MKKRFFAVLLVLSILLSAVVLPAGATAEDMVTPAADACPCGCGEKLEDVTWKPWAAKPGSGHYYLTSDYVMGEFNVISGESTVLDLRGYTITTQEKTRLFTVNGYLAILDTVGGGRVSAKGEYHEAGGVVVVKDNETTGSKFELFSGTICLAEGHTTPGSGGLVYAVGGGTFVMHNGLLLEGVSHVNGGCLAISGETSGACVLGGQIVGGTANAAGGNVSVSSGTLIMENTTVIGGTAKDKGGNLYISAATANIAGCTIGNGTANHTTTGTKYGGGNICTYATATLTLSDSEIYGGYALLNGGNICFGNGTHVLTNNKIWGGNCGNVGANVYSALPNAITTIDGGEIAGDAYFGNSPLTLKGALKIGMNATGLVLKQTSKSVKISGLTAGAEVYVSGATSKVSGSLTYLKPALNAKLSASGTAITVAAADGETAGYCPHCEVQTAWQPYGTQGATHVYLTADMAGFAEVTVTTDLCIDLCGFDITATGRAFSVAAEGKLTILDSVGAGVVTGTGVAGEMGGVISNAGSLTLRGGKYVYAAGNKVTGGGVIYTTSNVTAVGAILDATAFENAEEGVSGGAIYMPEACGNLTLNGCRVLAGHAYRSSGVYMAYNNTANIDGCQIIGGKAHNGSNLCLNADSSHAKGFLNMSKTLISGGESTDLYTGNFQINYWGAKIAECYIRDGKTKSNGGNIYFGIIPSSGVVMTDTIISGGTADDKGGNIYAAGNSKKLELINCLITDGTAATGGNITINNGVFTISGGEVSYGTATGNGGNINANTAAGLTLTGGAMLRGGHTDSYGGNIYVEDTVNLADVTFHNGSAVTSGGDVYLSGTSKLTIDSGLAGDVYLCAAAKILTPGENGTVVGNLFLKEGAEFNANIYLGGSYNNAALLLVGDSFCTASTMVTDGKTEQWFASNAEAVAACQQGQYIKLYTNNDLVLTKDLYVDLNGYTVAASGSGTLYGMDCVGDDYTGDLGKVTVSGGVTVAGETTAPGGNRYIALTEDGAYTFHRLDLRITGVSIRPSCAGIYYTAKWACDDTLKAQIASYGVVASTANMPGSNFASEEENIYTSFTKDSFVSGETKTGAVISGILKDDGRSVQENTENGKQKVYAKAYIVFENGQTLVSADNVGLSLYEVMKNLDRLIMEKSNTYRRYTNTARAFYETWKENGMGDWQLKKIPDPGEDGIINLLMIGNSFCSYYVDELHYLAAAAGIQMRVCNVYYSGCPIKKHYNWWIEGEANYQFFEIFSDTNGRVGTSNMSLEQCLAQYEWDVITLQEGTSTMAKDGAELYFRKSQQYWEPLLDYLLEQFPNAQIGWKDHPATQVVHGKEDEPITPEEQRASKERNVTFAELICNYYNAPSGEMLVQHIPVASAWQKVRDTGYDFLMCRLNKTNAVTGVAHAGDGYHDGDIGGGQFLNACIWFECLTGISCLDVDYVPEYKTTAVLSDSLLEQVRVVKTEEGYTLDPEFVQLLKQCAHEAVAECGYTVVELP